MEADVFQHHDLAVAHRFDGVLDRWSDTVVHMANGAGYELAEPRRQGRGPVRVVDLAVRAAKMRDEDEAGAPFDQVLNRRDRLADAGVVDDAAVLQGDIEIDAHQHPLAGDVDVANGGFVERPADRGVRGQFSRSPMYTVRSTTRHE